MKHCLFAFLFGSVLASGALGISQSMSCTYANGERRCESSHDDTGNVAVAGAAAHFGPGLDTGTYRGAGTGNTRTNVFNVAESASGIYSDYVPPNSGSSGNQDESNGDTSGNTEPNYTGDSSSSSNPNPDSDAFYPPFDYYVPPPPRPYFGMFGFPGAAVTTGAFAGAGPGVGAFAGAGGPPFGFSTFAGAGGPPFVYPFSGTGAFASAGRRR